jgi:hypothetical protein
MTEFTVTVLDFEGKEIKVGTKVRFYEDPPTPNWNIAEVIEISDFEGDVDDNTGQSIMNPPSIKIKYGEGSVEEYSTSEWEFKEGRMIPGPDGDPEPEWNAATGKCEELMVVE